MLIELKSDSREEADLIYYAIRKALILKKSSYKVKAYSIRLEDKVLNQFSVIPGISTSSVKAMAVLESAVFKCETETPVTLNITVNSLPFRVSDIQSQRVKGIGDEVIFEGVGNPGLQLFLTIDKATHSMDKDVQDNATGDYITSSWFAPEYVETAMEYDEAEKMVRITATTKSGELEQDIESVRNFFRTLGDKI